MTDDRNFIRTGVKEFDELIPRIRGFLEKDVLETEIDGKTIRGYRSPDTKSIWIRDHSDMMRGAKYFDVDMKSAVEHFAETQSQSGRVFDYFTTFPEKIPCEKENWTKYVRVPVEADVEYRFIKAAFLAWQATGDDNWILNLLPNLEKALSYIFENPQRYDPGSQLIKRPYTIDTWDFAYTAGKHDWLQFQIDQNTFWGIFHGDNSGYYEAFKIMELITGQFEFTEKASDFRERANTIKNQTNELCWNGSFYSHFIKLTPVVISGVNEELQLSLSNPMAINRGLADHFKAISILNEYIKRRSTGGTFAEWFSMDPPFPGGIFGDEKLKAGAYINGGIFPLVGGELAKAAFDHGYENYGVDILKRYYQLISKNNESWLWYFPDGTPSSIETSTSPDAQPTDGWGSTAMLYGLVEGLAGIEDAGKLFEKVLISPRWLATGIPSAEVRIEYAESGSFVHYTWSNLPGRTMLEINSPHNRAIIHLQIPSKSTHHQVTIDGSPLCHTVETIEQSKYINFYIPDVNKCIVEITYNE